MPATSVDQFLFAATTCVVRDRTGAANCTPPTLRFDSESILFGQGVPGSGFLTNTTRALSARRDQEEIGPKSSDFFRDLRLSAAPDRDHADDCGNANDNSEHCQQAPHLIHAQRTDRNTQPLKEIHEAASRSCLEE